MLRPCCPSALSVPFSSSPFRIEASHCGEHCGIMLVMRIIAFTLSRWILLPPLLFLSRVSICGERCCGSRAAGHDTYSSHDQELGLPPSIPFDLASLRESLCDWCRNFSGADRPGLKASLSPSEARKSLFKGFCRMILCMLTYLHVNVHV